MIRRSVYLQNPMLTPNKFTNRTLMRTEQTIDKIMAVFPYSHIKKVKKYLHQELRGSNLRDKLLSQFSSIEPSQRFILKQHPCKPHHRSARSLFSNAHKAAKDQSFITIDREKSQSHRLKNHRQTIKNTLSEKLMATIYQHQEDESLSPNLTLEGHLRNKQHQTISYVSNQQKYRRKSSFKQSGSSEPIKDYSAVKRNQSFSMEKSNLHTPQQTNVSKKAIEKHKGHLVVKKEGILIQKPISQHQVIQRQHQKKQQQVLQHSNEIRLSKAASKTPPIPFYPETSQNKTVKVQKKLFQPLLEKQKQKTAHRQKSYHQASSIDLLDIEQIRFQEPRFSTQNYTSNNFRQTQLANHKTYEPTNTSYAFSTIEEILPKQKSTCQQQIVEINHRKIKMSKKEVRLSTIDSSIPQDLSQQFIFIQKTSLTKAFDNKQIQAKHQINLQTNILVHDQSKQLNEHLQTDDIKVRVIQTIKKVGLLKADLQMLAELATFFSQNSKTFKINKNSQEFIRSSNDLKWHKLAYLCFRFFYSFLTFVQQYYSWASSVISIKRGEIETFRAQNKQLRDTLLKVQKSVRKNLLITSEDQVWLSNAVPKVPDKNLVQFIENLIGKKSGKIKVKQLLDDLHDRIISEAALVIKSIFLSKVLGSQTKEAFVIKEGVFRILNACIILHLFRSYSQGNTQSDIKPILEIPRLSNPSVELFKRFYSYAVENIFDNV